MYGAILACREIDEINDEARDEDDEDDDVTFAVINVEALIDNMGLPFHHSCVCHTLSLIMTNDMSKFIKENRCFGALYHPTLSKCFGLWISVSRSSKSSEIAREIMKKKIY